jgi:lysophospholipase L1-like esterase
MSSGEKGIDPVNDQTNGRPTLLGMASAIAIGCVLLVFAAEGVLRIAMPLWQEFYSGRFMRVVPVPGYGLVTTGRPGFDGYFSQNNGDFRVRLQINEFGFRNPDPVEEAEGRIWFIGDSMAFGWGVEQNQMYSSVAGTLLNAPTYNVASPGTDVCGYQALLARTLRRASPRAVIVGLILENDIGDYDCRAEAQSSPTEVVQPGFDVRVTSIKGLKIFLMRNSALYNFFAVSLKRVAFINEALISIGLIAKGHAYRPANTLAGFDRVIRRTAGELANVKAQLPAHIPFAVLIAPARFEIHDRDPAFQKVRREIVRALAARGIAVIDPIKEFIAAGFKPTHFAHDGHWSPLGHKIAGRAVASWLRQQNIGN